MKRSTRAKRRPPNRFAGALPSRRTRQLGVELLETRRLLVGQGEVFSLNEVLDTSGLLGDVSAEIHWGDATSSAASSVGGGNQTGDLEIVFDYTLDTSGFFSSQLRRDLLQVAADTLVKRFTDQLDAIVPTVDHQWDVEIMHPSIEPTGTDTFVPYQFPSGPAVPANTIIVFAGARDFPDSVRGAGGPATSISVDPITFDCTGLTQTQCEQLADDYKEFADAVFSRGNESTDVQPPTDFAPNIGSISFDNADTDWYFGLDEQAFPAGSKIDFLTVATHELAHLLGFGVSAPWQQIAAGGSYSGPNANAAYLGGGSVPLQTVVSGTPSHWSDAVLSEQPSLMTASLSFVAGERTEFSALDFAGLEDIGWEVVERQATVAGQHQYLVPGQYTPEVVLTGSEAGRIVYPLSPVTVTAVTQTLTAAFGTAEISEDSVSGVSLTLERGDLDTSSELVVTINGGPSGQLAMPATVTIEPNQSQRTIQVFPVNDNTAELTKQLSFTFTAPNHEDAMALISVLDDEPPLFQNPTDRWDVNAAGGVTASDALRIINELWRRGGEAILDPEMEQPNGVFYDVNGDYRLSALDALNVINELPNRAIPSPTQVAGEAKLDSLEDRIGRRVEFDLDSPQLF